MKNEPYFVKRDADGMTGDRDYAVWLEEIKRNFRSSQTKAAVRVNRAMLEFYWQLGRDIERLHAESKWGSSFYENLSLDLRRAFPEQKGFSVSNLKYVKRWYLFYFEHVIIRQNHFDEFETCMDGQGLDMPECFSLIPWGHHIQIMTASKTLAEAMFYIKETIENNWKGKDLNIKLSEDYYNSKGRAITNFKDTLPADQSEQALAILKDPYHFGFLRLREKYSEQDLEDALMENLTRFLLELGKGFAFVGRQMELRMPDGQSYFPDLVFYHTRLHSYVVVELKVTPFAPEFAGKLNFYVTAADELLRSEGDGPSVGLVICGSADKTVVEWSLRDINKPLGIASYELERVVQKTIDELRQKQNTLEERV